MTARGARMTAGEGWMTAKWGPEVWVDGFFVGW
jgi:hypothetical protein